MTEFDNISLAKEEIHDIDTYYIDAIKNRVVVIITDKNNNVFIIPKRLVKELSGKIATSNFGGIQGSQQFIHSFQDNDSEDVLIKAYQQNHNNSEPIVRYQYAFVNVQKKKLILAQFVYNIELKNNKLEKGIIQTTFGIKMEVEKFLEIGERLNFNFSSASFSVASLFKDSASLFE